MARTHRIALALLVALGCSEDGGDQAFLDRAALALEAGDDEAALTELEAALSVLPPDSAARARAERDRILVLARLGRVETAESFFAWAEANENIVRAGDRAALARAFVDSGRLGPAMDLLESSLRAHPGFEELPALDDRIHAAITAGDGAARGLWMLGELELEHYQRGRDIDWLNRALRSFVGSLETDGASADDRLRANVGQGWCYFWRGVDEAVSDFETPRAIFEQVLIGFPDEPQALLGLGTALLYQQRFDEAQEQLERAVAIEPQLSQGWFNLGQLHVRRRDWQRAADAFARADDARPDQPETLVWRAIAASESGKDTTARELLGRALALDPENVEAMVQLGIVHARSRRFDDALPWFERALTLDPENGNAYLQRGKVQAQLFEPQKAGVSLHQACALLPESYEAHYNLGALLAGFGQHAEALGYLQKALELDPAGPNVEALRQTIAEIEGRLALEGR